ncbi:MAG: hypothetical protein L0F95_00860 [Lactococcus sp.]|uniref:Uncharacterized protein n=1 Tax=Pseudolactococcus piscium MKFS47 TaxID=297352 RepID=A0A0D6DY93_9LACT|nr:MULTISPECIES: hypothetical protein [Lactococcus]MDN5440870.1 hypothetical protein [Lactococcus lactis]MCJ1971573.1 hypothetical protein [Lactococcus carnosus]MDN5410942.1 hypothetical protein [Lactococcus sp.]MDN5461040.1 hypothetical protein [Lactococcus sp.]MDN5465156.1 hypothetical protein [Lactococcus sp.]
MIDEIVGQAKQNQSEYHGNQFKKVDLAPVEPKSTTGRTDQKLADIAGVGKMTVTRMKKVKRESPELYEQVVKGERSITGAYNELPTTVTPKKSSEYPSHQKPTTKFTIPESEPWHLMIPR